MIARLKGTLVFKLADRVILDIQGVGYEVLIPFSTYYELGETGETVELRIYTHVREDALQLYGFLTEQEKKLFVQLIQLSGIGPRLGVTILSGMPVSEFLQAVMEGDVARLSRTPGVGKKTAERIVLELHDKVPALFPEAERASPGAAGGGLPRDVVSALVNLGYPRNSAETAVSRARKESDSDRFDVLLRASLKQLSG